MAKKTDIKLPKSVKKSDDKVQANYIKTFKKSMDKHNDEERARKKAISKLQKKYEKVDKRWVRKDDEAPAKTEKKTEKPAKKAEKKADKKTKKGTDKVASKKKSSEKKVEKKTSKKDTKKTEKSDKKSGKKSEKPKKAKKPGSKKSKSDDLLLDILSSEDFDPDEMIEVLENRVEDGENLTVDEASEEVEAMEDELLGLESALEEASEPEITEVGEYEGANPEEAEDPIAAQEAFEDALTEPNLAEALDEEQDDAVQPEATENTQGVTAGRLISDVTRAELYKEAQALKIPGRASMNKEQLFAAIELAR